MPTAVAAATTGTNYTYGAGAQLIANIVGAWSRFDSPFLYTPAALTAAMTLGIKFDQRAQERYPAANVTAILRYKRLYFQAETYAKHELEYDFDALAYHVQAGLLVVPKWLLLAGDLGLHGGRFFSVGGVLGQCGNLRVYLGAHATH